ncbi:unnamed protein product [marine sediment metagenome]|uniref:Uncharacterized protein n=1 Tax=marine sediment metagenome TaxID=412755 RepID=X1L6W9_9ZZZZ
MRPKQEILDDLFRHAQKLDPQHYELAAVAMIETEIQIDIRDILDDLSQSIGSNIIDLAKES